MNFNLDGQRLFIASITASNSAFLDGTTEPITVIRRRFVWLPGPPFSRFAAQVQLMKEPKLQPDRTQTDQQGPEPTTPTQSERPRRSRRRPQPLDAAEAARKKADHAVTQAAEGARRPAPVTTCQDQQPIVAIITGHHRLTNDFDSV
ncbi:hypothetical protein H0H81_001767 [Sphagnurus paluster]|uniref:Uncharacterized protein n=1 Tax=Sphagnurus paluster TaxID=117069 RepID=A0A9P7GMV1_9AGAR|nr:hypothetical protein H0H81_001767 [Sphagnurus paluster]